MTENKGTPEKSKTICVKCKHALMLINKPGEGLCIKTTRNKTMDYVTGEMDYVWHSRDEIRKYGQWWDTNITKQKRLFGIFPRKQKEEDGERFWAKSCRHENPTGNCPTYEENDKDVRQAAKGGPL